MKVVTIVGARPQFVKAAVVSRALRAHPGLREVLVHTGQHYDEAMSEVFFEEMGIPRPDYMLGAGSGGHGSQTGRMLAAVEEVLIDEKPDWVLVYGDTNSTLAGALAAAKLHVPLVHVEAGLRSFNRAMPEEINRVLTDHASDLLLAPSAAAVANLRREGFAPERIRLVGDVMFDAVRHYGELSELRSTVIDRLGLASGAYVLATIHRADNTDRPERLRVVFEALMALEEPVVVPLHPRTRQALDREGLLVGVERALLVTPPLGYFDMLALERHARLVVTDSGGVQKEAHFHGVPSVIAREETEWVELVETGHSVLAPPTSAGAFLAALRRAMAMPRFGPGSPYGDGASSERIARLLEGYAVA